jgi:hypothetical protein
MVVGVSRITCGVFSTNWGVGLLATVGTGVAKPSKGVELGGTAVGVAAMDGISDPQLERSKLEIINMMNNGYGVDRTMECLCAMDYSSFRNDHALIIA